jgi:biotin carboxylase
LDLEAVLVENASDVTPRAGSISLCLDDGPEDGYSVLFKADLFDALARNSQEGRCTVLRLVFSQEAGTLVRSDFLSYRLHGCEVVHAVRDFLEPLSTVAPILTEKAVGINTSDDFLQLVRSAIGAVIAQHNGEKEGLQTLYSRLDTEFEMRLSFPWVVQQPLAHRRVFWVQGRANIEASRQFYQAAKALGITLVVLDEPGHWLEDDCGRHAHFREAFIPTNIDADEGLTQRIVDAVKAYPHRVDGIVSISDVRLPFIARACEILGLPTSSSAAYTIAGDKGLTRRLESRDLDDESFVLKTTDELGRVLAARKDRPIQFPLIVKPCTGWNSDCVVKVHNEDELYAAVRRASARHASSPARSTGVVVEPYIDGPEVDADFIMLDGEVLFCDITDDFPCTGDLPDSQQPQKATFAANFMETLMDVTSALPEDEKDMMRESLRKTIARCGFQSGVFHCEARVRDSRAYYKPRSDNGILDLQVRESQGGSEEKPSCYLHEINARPPGYICCVAAMLAYGVDYYAIRLLLSLGPSENARVRALSQPFLGGKPQYTVGNTVLAPTRAGIMASDDALLEFLDANPALRKHVVAHQTLKLRGDVVQGPDSSELWWVGAVTVMSRTGRKECLEIAQQVREQFDYRLMDDNGVKEFAPVRPRYSFIFFST